MEEIKVNETNEKVYHEVLDNGLDIYFHPNSNSKNFHITLGTKYGATYTTFKKKDEDEYHHTPNGVAHFLEHITFHLDGKEASDLFTPYGAYINAFTSPVRTCYIVDCNNNFDKCLDNLLYYVYTPYYTDETVKNEKGIFKEESKRGDDDPRRLFYRAKMNALFSKSNHKEKIVGELDEIDSITLEDINNAYNTFYNPAFMYLIISGDFDVDKAMKIITKRMKSFKFDKFTGIDVEIPDEDSKVNKEYDVVEANILNDKASYQIKIPLDVVEKTGLSLYEYYTYLGLIISANLDGTSDYYRELLEKDIVPFPSGAWSDIKDNFIIVDISNAPKEGKTDEFIKITEKYLKNLVIDDKVIKRKIKCMISDYILLFDDNGSVANNILNDIIYFGKYRNDTLTVAKNFTHDKGESVLKSIPINNKSIVIMKSISE